MLGILNDVPNALLEEFGCKRSSVLGGTLFVLNVLCKENDELFPRRDTEVLKQCICHGWEIMHGSIWREELNNDVETRNMAPLPLHQCNITLHFLSGVIEARDSVDMANGTDELVKATRAVNHQN
jgi:hypothetical protein